MSATGSDSYFYRILNFNFWAQMVGLVSLCKELRKVAGLGSRSLVEALSGHGLSPKSWHLQFFGGAPKICGGFPKPLCRALLCIF
jgi:hypothetical protein